MPWSQFPQKITSFVSVRRHREFPKADYNLIESDKQRMCHWATYSTQLWCSLHLSKVCWPLTEAAESLIYSPPEYIWLHPLGDSLYWHFTYRKSPSVHLHAKKISTVYYSADEQLSSFVWHSHKNNAWHFGDGVWYRSWNTNPGCITKIRSSQEVFGISAFSIVLMSAATCPPSYIHSSIFS